MALRGLVQGRAMDSSFFSGKIWYMKLVGACKLVIEERESSKSSGSESIGHETCSEAVSS